MVKRLNLENIIYKKSPEPCLNDSNVSKLKQILMQNLKLTYFGEHFYFDEFRIQSLDRKKNQGKIPSEWKPVPSRAG